VLLPAYNAEMFLKGAVESILKQSFVNFEFLIINDGSTDSTSNILKSISDNRIKIIEHSENKGLIFSLNEGILNSQCEFIVRMDADDLAFENRIQVQVDFMNANPNIDAAGSYYEVVDREGFQKMPTSNYSIKAHMLFHTAMAHPTMILRRESFVSNNLFFKEEFKHAEDYELWSRASKVLNFANIPEVLLKYRFHENQVSTKFGLQQKLSINQVHYLLLDNIGIHPTDNEKVMHASIAYSDYGNNKIYLNDLLLYLKKIEISNQKKEFYNDTALSKYLNVKWFLISGHLALEGISIPILGMKKNFKISNFSYLKNLCFLFLKIILGKVNRINK